MAVDIVARGMAGSLAETVAEMSVGYKAGGSIRFSELPTPSNANLNYMYNIEDDFTTDNRFIEGSGKHFKAGTNVAIIEKNGSYYFDVYGTFIDLTNYVQQSELSEAISSKVDKITNVGGYNKVYAVDNNNTQTSYRVVLPNYDVNLDGVLYRVNGKISCATPTANNDAANKQYVDTATTTIFHFLEASE